MNKIKTLESRINSLRDRIEKLECNHPINERGIEYNPYSIGEKYYEFCGNCKKEFEYFTYDGKLNREKEIIEQQLKDIEKQISARNAID